MFSQKRDQIIKKLNKLDVDEMNSNEIYDLKLAFDQLFKNTSTPLIDLRYAYDIVKNTNVVVFEWGLDINVPTLYVSENVCQFGYKPEDFYSGPLKDYWAFLHPEDIEKIKQDLYYAREIGQPYVHDYRVICKSGEVRWVEERVIYERDSKGILTHEKGILFDITEMKSLQYELEASKERYKRIFQNSSVIILTIDLEGYINAVNQMFVKTFAYEEEEVLGKHIRTFLVNKEDDLLINKDISSEKKETLDVAFFKKNKDIIVLNLSSKVIDALDHEIEIVAVDVSEKKKDEQKIRYLSYHDKLTKLYNRAYFDEMLEEFSQRNQFPFSVIVGDLNGLKDLNDNYGHKSGDVLLQDVAKIIMESCRDLDIVCRIGGDEFGIICPNTHEEGARALCQRIRDLCLQTHIEPLGYPSIALGFSTMHNKETSVEALFKAADDHMYKNKMTFKKSTSGMYIRALQIMLEKNSYESKNHTNNMENLAIEFGNALSLGPDQMDDLSLVALLHDIGKVGIPNDILNKPGPLTSEEYNIVKGHSYIGYSILETVPATHQLAQYILYHHEWYDGSGYPEGLKAKEIPLISRIIHLIDAFEVMTRGTIYKAKKSKKDALEEIKSLSGIQFDPDLIKILEVLVL